MPDEQWDETLERIRSLRFPADELLDPFLARRLDAILERRRKPTSLALALIAEHTGVTVHWLLTGQDPLDDVRCWHYEPGSPCDWKICRQPERLAAGDPGTDPARPARDQP